MEPEIIELGDTDRPTRDVVHLLWLLMHRGEQVAPLVEGIRWEGYWGALAAFVQAKRSREELEKLTSPGSPMRRTYDAVAKRAELYREDQVTAGMEHLVHRLRQEVA